MKKQEKRKMQKSTSLLNSAYELFTTIGFSRTTIDDIVKKAGVGKGTFYNYFQDKYDVRDALIVHKSAEIMEDAFIALNCKIAELTSSNFNQKKVKTDTASAHPMETVDKLLFIVDYILNILSKDIALLRFISKNLSWGLFMESKGYSENQKSESMNLRLFIMKLLAKDGLEINKQMELKIFTILELVNSTCYTVILEGEPVTFSEYKPFLYKSIRNIFIS